MRAMVARALTGGLSLLLTDARCADATCTFTFDFTDVSRLRTSTAPSRLNAPRTACRIRFRSARGPEAGEQERPGGHRSRGVAHDWHRPADPPDDAGRPPGPRRLPEPGLGRKCHLPVSRIGHHAHGPDPEPPARPRRRPAGSHHCRG